MAAADRASLEPNIPSLIAVVAAQLVGSRVIRIHAWPEVLVPAGLAARGWALYREILTVHPPLGFLFVGGVIRLFGTGDVVIRALAASPALACQVGIWAAARRLGWSFRAWSAAALVFFATFLLWDGNSVYLEVLIAPLTIPLYLWIRADRPGRLARAAALFGVLLAIKQTVLFATLGFLAGVRGVGLRRRVGLAALVAAPLAAFAAAFAVAGSGPAFVRWVAEVPLTAYRGRTSRFPFPGEWNFVLLGILPVAAFWLSREAKLPRILAPALVGGFLAMAWPHFELVHLTAAAPGLALLAGEAANSMPAVPLRKTLAVVVLSVSVVGSLLLLATDDWSGAIEFWHSKIDDGLTSWLSRRPAAPLYLYGIDQDVYLRSNREPPGRLYVNPQLWFNLIPAGVESRQIAALRSRPDTIVIRGEPIPSGSAGRALSLFLASSYEPCGSPVPGAERLCPRRPLSPLTVSAARPPGAP